MSQKELETALEPIRTFIGPFAATKRKSARNAAAPEVLHLSIPYRQWDGPELTWAEDFGKGKGQVYSRDASDPIRSCNEVEVAKRLRRIRPQAVWVSCYSPAQIPLIWRGFAIAPEESPRWLANFDATIRKLIRHKAGGIPDVVGWNDDAPLETALFVECKGANESFKEGQEDWVLAAVASGLRLDQIGVAIRSFV